MTRSIVCSLSGVLLLLLSGCGSESAKQQPAPSGPVSGQIGNHPFTVRGARADWSTDGKFLTMAFAADELSPCTEPRTPVRQGWVELDVNLTRANAGPGKTGSYAFRAGGPSETHASAAVARYLDDGRGGLTQDVTMPSGGSVAINSVSADRIEGTLTAEDSRSGLDVRGTFAIAICPSAAR